MASNSSQLRRGLPRTPGGEPWPPEGSLPDAEAALPDVPPAAETGGEPVAEPAVAEPAAAETSPTPEPAATASSAPKAQPTPQDSASGVTVRRGLPRTPGGEPWPPYGRDVGAGNTAAAASAAPEAVATEPVTSEAPKPEPVGGDATEDRPASSQPAVTPRANTQAGATQAAPAAAMSGKALRRGLPRTPGGEPWPAAGYAPAGTPKPEPEPQPSEPTSQPAEPTSPPKVSSAPAVTTPAPEKPAEPKPSEPASQPEPAEPAATAPVKPTPAKPEPAKPVSQPQKPAREPAMIGGRTLGRWMVLGVLTLIGAIAVAGILVLAARGVTTLPGGQEFLERYPGEYELPAVADTGFAAWARWTHFLNFFLIVLIIRSGLLVRQQQKPSAYWTPRKGGKKVSIYLWLHTSLDILWLVNGLVFVVLLFATGHWARIVPTSWEVFPNAASALLQYMMLDWPTENGWVNYNSLQQLMYFIIIFVAAPLAAITGARLSEWWPKNTERLNRVYPAPLARALHFPTMLFFVAFILIHVFLVLATGALRNLNHMFAGTDVVNWAGFWWFVAAILVTAGAVAAARPLVLAPIANLFGKVSQR